MSRMTLEFFSQSFEIAASILGDGWLLAFVVLVMAFLKKASGTRSIPSA
jgi:hypothetical protein